MKVFVTGGNGFMGKRLISALSLHDHEVFMLTRQNKEGESAIHMVKGDLTSKNCLLEQGLQGCELIYHCAGEIRNTDKMKSLHVDGTKRLVQAVLAEAKRSGRVIHWVQLSSVGAYGPPLKSADEERVVTETTPTNPIGIYEVTKTQSDNLVMQAAKSGFITYSIVRPSNVIGNDMPNQSLRQLGMMVRKGLFFYIGRPGAIATYVHVDDVVEVLLLCGFNQAASGQVFNVSNDCLLEEMINGIADALAVKHPRLRISESLVRSITRMVEKFIHVPLTQERINTLVTRTRYPYTRLEKVLKFIPNKPIPSVISEVVSS